MKGQVFASLGLQAAIICRQLQLTRVACSGKLQKYTSAADMSGDTDQAKLDAVPDVDIDPEGKFKYVLIKATIGNLEKLLVRGNCRAEWHADVYDETWQRLEPLGVETECLGGGRILHEPGKKHIKVFGYSQGFGRAKHSITVDLLKKKYAQYTNIEWSDDGY